MCVAFSLQNSLRGLVGAVLSDACTLCALCSWQVVRAVYRLDESSDVSARLQDTQLYQVVEAASLVPPWGCVACARSKPAVVL